MPSQVLIKKYGIIPLVVIYIDAFKSEKSLHKHPDFMSEIIGSNKRSILLHLRDTAIINIM